jgi:hypothetical protein
MNDLKQCARKNYDLLQLRNRNGVGTSTETSDVFRHFFFNLSLNLKFSTSPNLFAYYYGWSRGRYAGAFPMTAHHASLLIMHHNNNNEFSDDDILA